MEFFAAFIFVYILHFVDCSLFCGKCKNVTDVASMCQDFVLCHASQVCYTERTDTRHGHSTYSLGCRDASHCASGTPNAIGRSLHQRAPSYGFGRSLHKRASGGCHLCCNGNLCNVNLCQVHQIPVTTTPPTTSMTHHVGSCFDRGNRCSKDPDVKNLVCAVEPHLCEKSCGICNGANQEPTTHHMPVVTTASSISTTTNGACFDSGDGCSRDPEVKNIVCSVDPHLCEKSCGICS